MSSLILFYHLCIVHTRCKLSEGIYILYKRKNNILYALKQNKFNRAKYQLTQ